MASMSSVDSRAMARPIKQLLYAEMLARPAAAGGPWSWNEPGNNREKGFPRNRIVTIFQFLDFVSLCKMEGLCTMWKGIVQSSDCDVVWQNAAHQRLGKERIERFKDALGLKCRQSYEQESKDLQIRNWKKIMRLHRSTCQLPSYPHQPRITEIKDNEGPVLCMCTGGPYLFTGGADRVLRMYRIPAFLFYTPATHRTQHQQPPKASRTFGVGGFAHNGPVLCLAARREFVVTGSVDGSVKLWKVESSPGSKENMLYLGHTGPVWCLALTLDGASLVSGSQDKRLLVWDVRGNMNSRLTLKGHSGGVTAVCSVEDSDQVVSAGEEKRIRIWSVASGECLSVLEGGGAPVFSLCSWRGVRDEAAYDIIFSGAMDGSIRVWDRIAAVERRAVQGHDEVVKSLNMSLSPEMSLISASTDGKLRLWRPDTLKQEREVKVPEAAEDEEGFTHAVVWANLIVASSWDGTVRIFGWKE